MSRFCPIHFTVTLASGRISFVILRTLLNRGSTVYVKGVIIIWFLPQGELDYELQENDSIVFISTLHGG